ncbi:ATP-binding cassette domain-containing protein [Siminovitchia sp. FSL H7-0308]|uniref:Sodium transport system ATP-binding protein n=1 Tax=Siminovitchia thermophila TaxID=1245522 RepID=A0ABS2R8A3_9BACI|nr:ATP-binding cassette domain-containing protein [Siminovitchia thermophila]MBM7715881.1 sodium transport system ATP-binding protein [Siminovitchia thermophila]ONK23976.1 ABC transporter ATP-binding protein [Bacillus sp. VT-16-64]
MIQVAHVSKQFKDKKQVIKAVDYVSLQIRKGHVTGLIGENGAGKTTLLRMLCTLIEPDEGTISIDGENIFHHKEKVRRRLGVLFGSETGLYNRLTAKENLEYFGNLYGMTQHDIKNRIETLAKRFGMRKYMDRKVEGFSKGMKQKVAIARTLIHDPDIILFDEPTTGLDITSSNIFREFIYQFKSAGKTIVFSTHIMDEIAHLCEDVIMMHKGQIVYEGGLEELYEAENSRDLNYLFTSKVVRGDLYV